MCKKCMEFVYIRVRENPWILWEGPIQVFKIIDYYRGITNNYGYLNFVQDFDRALNILKRRLAHEYIKKET
jgi:hypothetical protein